MPGGRTPGPLSQEERPVDVRDGTSPRLATPAPGTLRASPEEVARWPLEQKLLAAAERAADYLPGEAREQFLLLFTPECLAITAAVMLVWAGSHYVGIGFVADILMLLVALGTLGWQAIQVGQDLGRFAATAADATSEADLDRAAMHLASAVSTVGVTVFSALVFKAGARLPGKAGALAAARAKFWGRTVEEWLIVLTRPKAPPLVRERLQVALAFFKDRLPTKPFESIKGYLGGIDLSQTVRRVTLGRGDEVVMYGDPGRPGLFYSKVGTGMNRLGINPNGRQFVRYRIKESVEALESRAASVSDTWTQPGKRPLLNGDGSPAKLPSGRDAVVDAKYDARGGGLQYIIPDMEKLIQSGAVEVVKRP